MTTILLKKEMHRTPTHLLAILEQIIINKVNTGIMSRCSFATVTRIQKSPS